MEVGNSRANEGNPANGRIGWSSLAEDEGEGLWIKTAADASPAPHLLRLGEPKSSSWVG